ncbi:MAG: OmpA family protein [Burkholderiales bacterium]
MNTSKPGIEWLDPEPQAPRNDAARLAKLLIEVARSINPELAARMPSALGDDPQVHELRGILVGREQAQLARLQHRLDDPEQLAAALSQVLPAAIAQAAARDDRLGEVLAPTVERATQSSIRKDPRTLIDILSPVMGPAIRKSIAEAMESRFQGLNAALKESFSIRGLKWRIEAWRTGTPFADVVLRHTLIYRVEHVFLIQRKSGLLIEHVSADRAAANDPQLVSGMLTAIQDFVRDSFNDSGDGGVDTLRLGELVLLREDSPHAYLAAVVRGTPPEALRALMRETLALIHSEHARALETYVGDAGAFGAAPEALSRCLREQARPREAGVSIVLWIFLLVLIGALCFGAYALYQRYQEAREVGRFVEALRAEPGIVVARAERQDGRWQIAGLRDPLAPDPRAMLDGFKLEPTRLAMRWEAYQALHPAFVMKRVQAGLEPIPTVSFVLERDRVRAIGSAPHPWIERARALSRLMPLGAPVLDLSELSNVDRSELDRMRLGIEAEHVYFDVGSPRPERRQEALIEALALKINALAERTRELQLTMRVNLIGHADSTGKDVPNLALSVGRAEVVRSLLRTRGVDPDLLFVRGAGALEPVPEDDPLKADSRNRRVSFSIRISE